MSPNIRAIVPAILLVPLLTGVSSADEPIRATVPRTDGEKTVTLITGDQVSISKVNGKSTMLIKPGSGRETITFRGEVIDDHVHVVPSDAGPLLRAGRLDPRLFDVTQLIEFGYDDLSRDTLPLILTGAAAPRARVTHQLSSINGVAFNEPKQSEFWRTLNGGKVWLSGKVKVDDEGSNKQIGVPKAREGGFDGRGVTVAVLDTGVDVAHPDLKGVLGETKDFTDSPDGVKDTVGHGTHVASIIAGTGAQTAANEGVAPKAGIVMGKVCGDTFCEEAAILAGMEWAAGKARVVNMSLGGNGGTNDDLLAQAANSLTASTGALFVASAGNAYNSYQVATPASADAALAVASVSRTDELSSFSSEGPRRGDHAVKPDIAAPGEDIVAARAAGTAMGTPVDDFYTAASGTSMSAPHVAGVAALVAQAHPDWKADRIKAALMSSAAPKELGVFQAGTGRVDAAQAVAQTVFADGNVSFPRLTWPYTNHAPSSKTVTYRNDGSGPVTLNLAVDNAAFSLGASTVTVPANGTATATVTLDPAKLPSAGGTIGTRVAATADGVAVQTAVGVVAEPESYNVVVTVIDRNGNPASDDLYQSVGAYSHTLDDWDFDVELSNGVGKVRLPKGDYSLGAETTTAVGDAENSTRQFVTKYTVDKDSQITLDARKGVRASLSVADRPEAVPLRLTFESTLEFNGRGVGGMVMANGKHEVYVVPTTAADGTTLGAGLSAVIGSPEGVAKPYQYYVTAALPENVIPERPQYLARTNDLARRDVRLRAQGVPAQTEFARSPFYYPNQFFGWGAYTTTKLPATRTDYLSTEPRWLSVTAHQRPLDVPNAPPFGTVFDLTGTVAAGRPVPEEWNAASVSPSLAFSGHMSNTVQRSGDAFFAYIPMFSPAGKNMGSMAAHQAFTAKGDTTLALEGQEPVASGQPGLAYYTGLPAKQARYTLSATATRIDWMPWYSLSTKTEASWTFQSSDADQMLPLMSFRTTGAFDGLNRAPCGLFTLSIDVLRQMGTTSPAKVKTVNLEYSTDDGATWKPARVLGSGNSWRALLVNPDKGFVSLRTSATDSAGDRHSTTVIRAYGIR